MPKKISILFIVLFLCAFKSNAQGTAGKDFWIGYMAHAWDCYYNYNYYNYDTVEVFLSSQVAATVKVEAKGQGYSKTVTLVPNVTKSVMLPSNVVCRYSDTVTTNGVHVTSDEIINVYAVNRYWYSKGATVVIPTESIVKSPEYFVTTDEDTYNWGWNCNGKSFKSAEFVIVGIADSSVIEIVPTGASTRNSSAGVPFQITLKKGETFQYLSTDNDLTGSIIRSKFINSKFAVFAGNRLTVKYLKDKNGNQCYSSWDHTYEQMLPTVTWGNNYTAMPFKNNPGGYYLKIVAAENNTRVSINGNFYKTLKQAEYFEYMLYQDTITTVTANNRISVAQFTKGYGCAQNPDNIYNGDPSQMQLFPDEQFGNNATVNTVSGNNWYWWWYNYNWWKPENYINIMVKSSDTASFQLNGKKLKLNQWKTAGNLNGRHFAQVKIDSGSHYMSSNKGFLAYVYGYSYVEGYAYAAAARFKPIQNNFIITNAQCKKDTVNFIAVENDSFGNYSWKFGDGGTATGPVVKHKFRDTGWFSVKMYTYHVRTGAKDSVSKDLYVADTKIKSLFSKDTSVCGPINYVVISKGFNMDNVYKWNDGHNVYYRAVKNPGLLWLEVTERNGCVFRDTLKVTGHNIPKANFSVSKDVFCLNKSKNVAFKNYSISKDTIANYSWDFGEKTINSFDSVLNYQYKKANTYAVMLKATTIYGCYHDTFQIVDVLPSPKADFSFTKKDTCFNINGILLKNNTVIDVNEHKRFKWYFSEGYNISNSNPSIVRTYASIGTYQVMLIYENNNKCIDSLIKTVTIVSNPIAGFKITSTSLCTRDSIQFKNTSTSVSKPLNYVWTWGDSTQNYTGKDSLPKHSYQKYGIYKADLIATSPQGCTDTFRKVIALDETPIVIFKINKDTQCLNNQSFNYTNLTTLKTGPMTYQWQLGDGNTSADSNVINKIYAKDSTYRVRLTATSFKGCISTDSQLVIVGGRPKTKFSINKDKQCFKNNSFNFTNNSLIGKGTLLKYEWLFGNAVKSNLKDIYNYSYATEDTFKVSLISTSNFGCIDTAISKVITVASPKSNFAINNNVQCFNGHLFKMASLSTIKYGTVSYVWKLGDNNTASDSAITKSYGSYGNFLISLITISNNNCTDTVTKSVTVNASPKAFFNINTVKQCFKNNKFNFVNGSSIGSGSIKDYRWGLGDGYTTNQTSIFNYKYAQEDTFKVSLVVNSLTGCADTLKSTTITFAQPKAMFKVNANVQCFNQQNFVFTNQSTLKYGQLQYAWQLGDGATSSDTNIVKKYTKDSTYNVRLISKSNNNCADTIFQTMVLHVSPKSDFVISKDKQCYKNNVFTFGNRSSVKKDNIIQFTWLMDDGNQFNAFNVNNYKFTTEDTFSVQLISKTNNNCLDTVTKPAITFAQPIVNFVIPKDTQCWQKNFFNFNNQTTLKYGTLINYWQFGDKSTSTEFNPSTKSYVNKSATYLIKYRTISDHGCADSMQRKIVLLERPISEFTINDSIQCFRGHLFSFANKTTFSVPSTLSYWWDYNNGITNTGFNPQNAIYKIPGLYNLRLVSYSTITNCFDTLVKIVIPAPHAVVDYTINKDTQCFRFNDFRFNNLSTLQFGTMKYNWQFRDNTTDTSKNPIKHYLKEQSYLVKLVANTNYDCKDSIEKQVQFHETPIAKMSVNKDVQCYNNHVFNFTNGSTLSKGSFTQNWVFADATNSASYNENNKTFKQWGNIDYYLSVISNKGCTDSVFDQLYLEKNNNSLIGLNANDNDSQCLADNSFRFFAVNSNAKVAIANYDWRYGDGQFSNSANPTVQTYNKDGAFIATLYTISANGCNDTAYFPVVIHPQPVSAFSAQAVCFPEPTKFVDLSTIRTGTIVKTVWYYADGASENNVLNPTHQYKSAGIYDAALVNYSNYGCKDSLNSIGSVIVNAKPKAAFSFTRLKTIVQDETRLQFNNEASNDVVRFDWDFGNATNSSLSNPIGLYHDTGRFNVTQIVHNAYCSDTITKNTGLLMPDFFYFLPNTFTPNSNNLNEDLKGVGSKYIYKFTMEIYNRWGEKVFECFDITKGWDGTYKGSPCMEGAYMCRIYLIPYNGPKQMIEEMVTLLR